MTEVTDVTRTPDGAGAPGREHEQKRQGLLANTGALLVSRVLMAGLGWGGTVLVARNLTREQFGEFTLVFTVLGMLSIVTDMGVGRLAISGVLDSQRDRARFAGSYLVLRTLMGLVGYLLAVGFVMVAGYPPIVVRATAIAGLVVVFATPSHAYDLAFQVHLRMGRVAAVNTVAMMAQFSLTAAVVVRGGGIVWLTVPAVLCEVVTLAMKAPLAHRLLPIRYNIDVGLWWSMLREAAPISLGAALATLYYKVDSLMLSKLDTFVAVADYGIAYKFVDLAHFLPSALATTVLTLLVRAWPDDVEAFRSALRRGLALLGVSAGLVLVCFVAFADEVVILFYGTDYADVADATRILVLAECIAYFSSLAFAALVASNRHRRYPFITLVGLVGNVALNAVLIPARSFEGAAMATLATEVLVVVLLWRELANVEGIRPFGFDVLRAPAGATAVAALVVVITTAAALPWVIAGTTVAAAYLATVHLLARRHGGLPGLLGGSGPIEQERPA